MHTISTTEALTRLTPNPRLIGGILCAVGLALMWTPGLIVAALGAELIAAAFWVWARATDDPKEQVARWAWLRRPAQALWLAAAIEILLPELLGFGSGRGSAVELLRWLQAGAVAWAGLELLAALPLARPYSDLSGPLLAIRPWLPAILPAAGFMLLWRHQSEWVGVPRVRDLTSVLLLVTAILAALRAFGRLQWLVSLRWLLVSDSALAALLVARGVVGAEVARLLWLAACGGRTFLLASELRSAAPRRGPFISLLWRTAGWVSSTCLSWPLLVALARGGGAAAGLAIVAAFPVAITAWVIVSRLEEAPERRMMVRPGPPLTLGHAAALITTLIGTSALATAWWLGLRAPWGTAVLALAPSLLAGAGAAVVLHWRRQHAGITAGAPGVIVDPAQSPERVLAGARLAALERVSERLRSFARTLFRWITGFERRTVGWLERFGRTLISPLHDLHTGDAQEYLLLLIGLSMLALVMPLLQ
jgi:hypothetical protein